MKEVKVPDLGGATDVTVIEILVKSGDMLAAEAPVVTLESDKATMEIPTSVSGRVKEINVKVGDKVSAGSVLVTLESKEPEQLSPVRPEEARSAVSKGRDDRIPALRDGASRLLRANGAAPSPSSTKESEAGDVHAGPGVRRLARELGVHLTKVTGSGPKQRILKEDIQAFVKHQLSQSENRSGTFPSLVAIDFTKFGSVETKPLSRLKKLSGNNLQRNWMMIPHVTQFGQADITELEAFRHSQKKASEDAQIKLTPLVFIMKAVAACLKVFPYFNASLDVNGEDIILKNYFNVGVAVDTPQGLVVPVIREVDKRGVMDLAKELAVVSEKARNKLLTPMDMQGGCFSISSLGGIGGTAFTPIINYPEVAILGVSKASYQPVYQAGVFVPRLMLPLSLSYDHRVIDGAEGARFIVHLTQKLADIRTLLL